MRTPRVAVLALLALALSLPGPSSSQPSYAPDELLVAPREGLAQAEAEALYRTLSKRGNPQLKSLTAILGATGLRLAVTPSTQR